MDLLVVGRCPNYKEDNWITGKESKELVHHGALKNKLS
jgi:hypothetical protein